MDMARGLPSERLYEQDAGISEKPLPGWGPNRRQTHRQTCLPRPGPMRARKTASR